MRFFWMRIEVPVEIEMTEVCHLSQIWEALTASHLQNYDPVGFLLIPLYVPSILEATGEAFLHSPPH